MKRIFFTILLGCLFLINESAQAQKPSHKKSSASRQATTQTKKQSPKKNPQSSKKKQIQETTKKPVNQAALENNPITENPMQQIASFSPEDQLKSQKIANDQLKKLQDFYEKINASPELNLAYRKALNKNLKQTVPIYQPLQEMTLEEKLIFLRAVNKKLKDSFYKQKQATVKTVKDQRVSAHHQAISLQDIPLKNMSIPTDHAAMIKMGSFTPLDIPAVPETQVLRASSATDSYDSTAGSAGEIRADLIKDVAKESRDLDNQAFNQDALNSDIKEANRANRDATNAVGGSKPTEIADFSAAQRDRRRIEVEGLKN